MKIDEHTFSLHDRCVEFCESTPNPSVEDLVEFVEHETKKYVDALSRRS